MKRRSERKRDKGLDLKSYLTFNGISSLYQDGSIRQRVTGLTLCRELERNSCSCWCLPSSFSPTERDRCDHGEEKVCRVDGFARYVFLERRRLLSLSFS